MNHLPYRGEVRASRPGGRRHCHVVPPARRPTSSSRAGRLRALGADRHGAASQSAECAHAGRSFGLDDPLLKAVGWIGFAAPAATPRPVVQHLADELQAALKLADVQQRIRDIIGAAAERDKFSATYRREAPVWEEVVRKSGATLD